jgi:hypothetical protein
MKIEVRSQESEIFIFGGGESAMTPVLKTGISVILLAREPKNNPENQAFFIMT